MSTDEALLAPSHKLDPGKRISHTTTFAHIARAKRVTALDLGTREGGGLQKAPRISHKFLVRRVIRRLDPLDLDHHLRMRMLDVLDEFVFLARWSDDEDGAGVGDRPGDFLKKILVLRRVAAADDVRLVVEVAHRILWAHHQLVHVSRVEAKYARLPVVDPDDGVIMALHCFLHGACQN